MLFGSNGLLAGLSSDDRPAAGLLGSKGIARPDSIDPDAMSAGLPPGATDTKLVVDEFELRGEIRAGATGVAVGGTILAPAFPPIARA
jgi:hypothetical protein